MQLPVPPAVVHGFGVVKRAGAGVDREADLRAVRRVLEAARAGVDVHVRREDVRLRRSRFVAVGGVIWMFASTNVLTASPEFRPVPSVCDRDDRAGAVDRASVADAWPVTLPAVGEVKMIVHWPVASVFAPASSQVLAAAFTTELAPFESVSVKSTCSPAAGTNVPVPVSFGSVTVKVCGWPTSLVASGAIEIFALTQVFDGRAGVRARRRSVSRVSVSAADRDASCAPMTVVTPVVAEVRSTVQLAGAARDRARVRRREACPGRSRS